MITADRALQQGRDLFAVPANVGAANAAGTNRLIRDGAHVALSARDILAHYEFLYTDLKNPVSGAKSDYDPTALAEMGVYSRVVGGFVRVPAQQAGITVASGSGEKARTPKTATAERTQTSNQDSASKTAKKQPAASHPPEEEPSVRSKQEGDRSCAAVASLNDTQRAVLEAIPSEEPIAVDKLKHLGYPMGTLLAVISVLQIKGLVRSLPGGMICRN